MRRQTVDTTRRFFLTLRLVLPPEKMDTKLWSIDTLSGRSSFRTLHFVQGRNPGRVSSQKQPTAWKKTKNGCLLFMTSQPSTGRICEQLTRSKASQLHASSMTV